MVSVLGTSRGESYFQEHMHLSALGVLKNDGKTCTVQSLFLNANQQFCKGRYGLFAALVSDNQLQQAKLLSADLHSMVFEHLQEDHQ